MFHVIGYRHQRTPAAPTEVRGVGFVTGSRVRVRFLPAPADAGVLFRRVDLPGSHLIPARAAAVTGTQRRTTIGSPQHGVTLVEHLLAALAGLRIDNCTVELDGPEPPGLDGSATGFVNALNSAGVIWQSARRAIWATNEPIVLSAGGATIALHPIAEPGLRISYILDYGTHAPIPRQTHTIDARPESFIHRVAGCRTFLTEAESVTVRAQGVGRHLTPADVLVFGPRGVIGNRLRFADEPARHKVLDLIGDLSLCGFDLAGHVVAYRSGHALNVELARHLVAQADAVTNPGPRSSCRPAQRRAA